MMPGSDEKNSFKISDEDAEYYVKLFHYFKASPQSTLDLNKGLFICGPFGTGKTVSMKLMQRFFRSFGIVSTRHLVRDYLGEMKGQVLDLYGRQSYKQRPQGGLDYKQPIAWCFDDLGQENNAVKLYGTEQNVMEEIISDRYEEFKKTGMRSYFTSNCKPEDITGLYGKRIGDRLREMVNVITYEGKSKRV